jgi:hypothetical protein
MNGEFLNAIREDTHVSLIRPGDTIYYTGHVVTVCSKDIHKSTFMGTSIFGDCFKLGYTPVKKVKFMTMYKGRLVPADSVGQLVEEDRIKKENI